MKRDNELIKFGLYAAGGFIIYKSLANTLSELLASLGIGKGKDERDVEAAASNPYSPFSGKPFLSAIKAGTKYKILTNSNYVALLNKLKGSFGWSGDNFGQAFAVFKSMTTQSEVAYFAWRFSQDNYEDLLTYLKGSYYPYDRLSSDEVMQIVNYVSKLPKYQPK